MDIMSTFSLLLPISKKDTNWRIQFVYKLSFLYKLCRHIFGPISLLLSPGQWKLNLLIIFQSRQFLRRDWKLGPSNGELCRETGLFSSPSTWVHKHIQMWVKYKCETSSKWDECLFAIKVVYMCSGIWIRNVVKNYLLFRLTGSDCPLLQHRHGWA